MISVHNDFLGMIDEFLQEVLDGGETAMSDIIALQQQTKAYLGEPTTE